MNNQNVETYHGIPLNVNSEYANQISELVEFYQKQMETHPLQNVFKSQRVPLKLLKEYASLQYIDSTLWVPMLAIMKDRVSAPRISKALKDNIMCEAGVCGTSHITLCMNFIKSLGVDPFFGSTEYYSPLAIHPTEMMNAVSGMSEGQIVGWTLVAEAIVPFLFQMTLAAYKKNPKTNVLYLEEHISVDSDEHAQWMFEGAIEVATSAQAFHAILEGIHLGGRTALSVPDALYAKFLRGAYDE